MRLEHASPASTNAIAQASAFFSSRTLPGHACARRAANAASETRRSGRPRSASKPVDELRQVVEALPQRRHRDDRDREAEEEVLAKAPGGDVGPQVAVRRRDDAHVDAAVDPAADAPDLAALERAKEARLQVERELGNLVEKERARRGRARRRPRAP